MCLGPVKAMDFGIVLIAAGQRRLTDPLVSKRREMQKTAVCPYRKRGSRMYVCLT